MSQNPMMHDDEGGHVLVVGSSIIDITGRPLIELSSGVTAEGRIRQTVGGVARNIAANLARLEVPTILLSAVADDMYGERVIQESTAAGINCDYVRHVENARTAVNMSVLHPDDELYMGISDFEIIKSIDSDYLQQHELLFSSADMVVIDATLSADVLETLFEIAAEYDLRVCADPTTPTDASKLCTYIPNFYLVVPNAAETVALCGVPIVQLGKEEETRNAAMKAAYELVRQGSEIAVVTLGAQGLAYAHSSGSGFIRAANVEVIDTNGAGDAFSAAVIFGLLNEVALDEAMRLGATAAALTLSTRETVYPNLTQERLYDELVV